MRAAALLLLLAAVAANTDTTNTDDAPDNRTDDTLTDTVLANNTNFNANDTLTDESDGEHEPVVRKKRTFGDIVFRGLADVLGYNVARKPPQTAFPPPLAPVPGIDTPLQAASTAAPVTAAPVVAAAPCGAARAAAAPPPCRAKRPPAPKPKAAPPCPKPRAAPKPKPSPPPPSPTPPPPPPPCAKARANPTTPSPCTPAPPAPPSPAKQEGETNLETISSNFQLNFNFNRKPVTAAPATAEAVAEAVADAEGEAEAEAEPEQEQAAPIVPIAIEPKAAKLPASEPRKPRFYVDAFLVRNGVAQKVETVDAKQFDPQQAADEDYLAYDEESEQAAQYDDYEDVQESRDREKAVPEFGTVVDHFWQKKKQQRRPQPQKLPPNHYKNVHFGDRDLGQVRLQSLQQEVPPANHIPLPLPALPPQPDLPETEEEGEATTTTEDPKRSLRPKVLPPTEHNPNEIDTVTVRVPPIYKSKRPKKHREQPVERDKDSTETEDGAEFDIRRYEGYADTDGEDSWMTTFTERPMKRRRRRRKQYRSKRSADESTEYSAGNYDYYGKKLPVSKEEIYYMQLTVPTPTKDADLARLEAPADEHVLDEHERLKDDSERLKDDHERLKEDPERSRDDDETDKITEEKSGRADSHEHADSRERSVKDSQRTRNKGRADSDERTDDLSPNARIHETGYQNNYVHATNVQVDDPNPQVATIKRETVTTDSP